MNCITDVFMKTNKISMTIHKELRHIGLRNEDQSYMFIKHI